jgi:hypothetical protein
LIAAGKIETSVVTRLQITLNTEEIRAPLRIPEEAWEASLQGNMTALVRSIVAKVSYDGISGDVALRLGTYKC